MNSIEEFDSLVIRYEEMLCARCDTVKRCWPIREVKCGICPSCLRAIADKVEKFDGSERTKKKPALTCPECQSTMHWDDVKKLYICWHCSFKLLPDESSTVKFT